jgi:hypothetical protein
LPRSSAPIRTCTTASSRPKCATRSSSRARSDRSSSQPTIVIGSAWELGPWNTSTPVPIVSTSPPTSSRRSTRWLLTSVPFWLLRSVTVARPSIRSMRACWRDTAVSLICTSQPATRPITTAPSRGSGCIHDASPATTSRYTRAPSALDGVARVIAAVLMPSLGSATDT